VWCSALSHRPQVEQRIAKFSVVPAHGSNHRSQRFDPLFREVELSGLGWSDSTTCVGSECHNMKTFLGQIVTESNNAGRSVTVSKWGGWPNRQGTPAANGS
jgi:hypothetical protein